VGDEGALRFAERLIALVDAGRKSATYKLAALLALIDLTAEGTTPSAGAPDVLSGREVARRVIELYWPQTAVYGVDTAGEPRPLRQSAQNAIPAKLAAWRVRHNLPAGAPLSDARTVDPIGWDELEADLIAVVIGMPLAKLQRFGDGRTAVEDRFIYQFGWRDEVMRPTVDRPGFDDRILLNAGVAEWLVQLAPLLRPLVQAKWTDLVARQNPELVDKQRLDDFLFGATRISLERIRQSLLDLQHGSCFYCRGPVQRSQIDHFLPWSRHPDNHLDNLVAAHAACNNAKSASIASERHLQNWVARLHQTEVELIATATGWPRRRDRTVGAVNATYLWLPRGARLWVFGREYEPADPERIRMMLRTAA
jgi:hypothetical protein